MRFLLAFLLMQCSHAKPEDLTGHLMEFQMQDRTPGYVDIPLPRNVDSATVCQRFFSDESFHEITLFSLATPDVCEAMTLSRTVNNVYDLVINGTGIPVVFRQLAGERSVPKSICVTYDAAQGLVQMWQDDKRSPIKLLRKGPGSLSGSHPHLPPRMTLGQVRLTYDLGNDNNKDQVGRRSLFRGEMKDVHMWDYVLDPCEIRKFMGAKEAYTPGNVINWASMEYNATANVRIVKDEYACPVSSC